MPLASAAFAVVFVADCEDESAEDDADEDVGPCGGIASLDT